jgi:hypothetical protein
MRFLKERETIVALPQDDASMSFLIVYFEKIAL